MPFFWIYISQYSQEKIVTNFIKIIGTQPVNLTFENLKIKTLRDDTKSIQLSAPQAKIYDLKISKIDLLSPQVTLSETDKPNKVLISHKGVYQKDMNIITLSDNVKLSENGGYKLKTDKMLVDLNNFAIKLPSGIDALYDNNSLKANDVEFQQKTNKAIFKGGVKLVIHPKGNS